MGHGCLPFTEGIITSLYRSTYRKPTARTSGDSPMLHRGRLPNFCNAGPVAVAYYKVDAETANAASWARDRVSVFAIRLATCFSTVRGDRYRRSPISLLESPSARMARTSISRRVTPIVRNGAGTPG